MNDLFNVTLIQQSETVDQVNKRFYERYNYPWQPSLFPVYPPGITSRFLNQDIGCWRHDRIPSAPHIWVAGCGTNQALYTALKFPEATVLGTDISSTSLEICRQNASQLGVTNLILEEKSLNDVNYEGAFDYIICTGVLHHNADPQVTLRRIARALQKDGILELMVYNYYHRLQTTACQKAIRTFYHGNTSFDMDFELSLLKELIPGFKHQGEMSDFISSFTTVPEAALADCLLQPVEFSYTIESLETLVNASHLEFLQYCPNQFDANKDALSWNLQFGDAMLKDRYGLLTDSRRWQIANLLLYKDSPMLWFYFQSKHASQARQTEQEIADSFLETVFMRASFPVERYVLNPDGNYSLSDRVIYSDALPPGDKAARKVLEAVDGVRTMRAILNALNIDQDFITVNNIRTRLTTLLFPYLLARPE